MKKNIIFGVIFAMLFVFAFGVSSQLDVVYAQDDGLHFYGESEIIAKADTMEFELFVKEVTEDFAQGQDKISSTIDCINQSLKQIDQDIVCTVVQMSCRPHLKKDVTKYVFDVCINVCTSKLDKLEEIIKTAGECGANGYCGVFYGIKEKQALINDVIENAKQDAINKARNEDKELVFEKLSIQDVCCFEQNDSIVVKAMVKANFVKVPQKPEVVTKECYLQDTKKDVA